MKFLFDLLPLLLFFAALRVADIYVATATSIVATVAQVGTLALLKKRIDPMLWVSLAIVVVFGGATLLLRERAYIMWKPSVLYWLFALILGVAQAFLGRNLVKAMLAQHLQVPEPVWRRVNWAWVLFFTLMGFANYYFAFVYAPAHCAAIADPELRDKCVDTTWATFKVFGATGLLVVFVLGQAFYLARHAPEDAAPPGSSP